ncbi:related to dna polymerase delta small subunit [Cephalotrichum gorgonifer]|uniref:DNA-directed DNA polymerase n=1 Tax=Cephalotrichum gorgonifer TaxID=2041049 RepID=A0AAE8SR70_9PEZI|nr:related to dna polymerase delta small subunit [Cephalotrichum gorgonifer]
MVSPEDIPKTLLQGPSDEDYDALDRAPSTYKPLHTFRLNNDRSYRQQYGDMYFLRLAMIKPAVEKVASEAWDGLVVNGERVQKVERVLDVRQGELCWVTGTVYMDMALKPNILEDVSNDRWLAAPATTPKYYSDDGSDQVMLEDDSGRIKLVGDKLKELPLVTGCIIAVMGTETANGELDVAAIKFADLPSQPKRWSLSKPPSKVKGEDVEMSDGGSPSGGTKVAIVSGLSFSGKDASYATELNLLLEFLLGEVLDPAVQKDISQITRLVIAGNSIARDEPDEKPDKKAQKKYGYDASSYNPAPFQLLDDFLAEILPSIPVTILPGADDPSTAALPQQPIHSAMFPKARAYTAADPSQGPGWFDSVTNPWEGEVEGWRFLGTGGQNVDDVFKYIGSDDRLGMMEGMCRWRCVAPTAPDTLWSYPFQEDEPFVIKSCPHVYFVGSQPRFSTKTIQGPDGQSVRLITVPSFAETGEIVLVDAETLEASVVRIVAGLK